MSVQLDLDHAKHYALELRDPIFLVHADVQKSEVFWYAPQLDNDLIQKLNPGKNESTVTVRVPTSNALPATAAKLLDTLELLYVVLGHRTLVASTMSSFANSLKYQPGQEKVREEFYRRANFLRFEKIQELIEQREYAEARTRAQLVVSDPDSSIENRFWAQEVTGAGCPTSRGFRDVGFRDYAALSNSVRITRGLRGIECALRPGQSFPTPSITAPALAHSRNQIRSRPPILTKSKAPLVRRGSAKLPVGTLPIKHSDYSSRPEYMQSHESSYPKMGISG